MAQPQLPLEICTEILCRCSNRSMIKSKVVCRAWRDLIESPEFAQFVTPIQIHIVEFPRMINPYETHQLRESNISIRIARMGGLSGSIFLPVSYISVNGLILLLRWLSPREQHLWVCNPITREYLTIPNPPGGQHSLYYKYGFGVSRRSNEYKVVWISDRSEWHVFTLGGAAGWRTLSAGPNLAISYDDSFTTAECFCAFLSGNLYWFDPDESRILCFDLESEVFTTFSAPPPPPDGRSYTRSLSVLKECVCLCDVWLSLEDREIHEVWLLKGDAWSKEYVIKGGFCDSIRLLSKVFPMRVLGDGSVLLRKTGSPMLYYFNNGVKRLLYPMSARAVAVFTPNFLPLKTLLNGMEVQSL